MYIVQVIGKKIEIKKSESKSEEASSNRETDRQTDTTRPAFKEKKAGVIILCGILLFHPTFLH